MSNIILVQIPEEWAGIIFLLKKGNYGKVGKWIFSGTTYKGNTLLRLQLVELFQFLRQNKIP